MQEMDHGPAGSGEDKMEKLRNIGIFAHVDAGKTTLSEQMLLKAGTIRTLGSVDRGTAHTDSLEVERRRGISVKASCVRLNWKGFCLNLIDTPGHTDFSAEIEESMWALDGAVLVICGVEGVQPQTELLFETFIRNGMPTVLFLNKMDRPGADAQNVLRQIHRRLSPHAALLTDAEAMLETVSDLDEEIMQRYMDGESIPEAEIRSRFTAFALEGKAFPVLTGSALQGKGIEDVLDCVITCLPPPPSDALRLSGVVFASAQDKILGRGL